MNRLFSRGEKPADVFNYQKGTHKFDKYFYLRIGEILKVDYDRYRMKVRWLTGSGAREWIPISFPYCGPAGCLGMVPEEHAIGIFSYFDEGTGHGSPLLISYLPAALELGLNYNKMKFFPDSVATEDENIFQYRFRKLNKGEMIMSSPLGSLILVSDGIEIANSAHDSIVLRYSDHSIISNSLNNFIFTDGVAIRSGLIIRNNMNLYNEDGSRIEGTNGWVSSLPDGRENVYIVPFGKRIEYDTKFYSEYRIDVQDIVDGVLDSNEITDSVSTSTRDPIVSLVMGNYVGVSETESTYGQILRPVLFTGQDDTEGNFGLIQCVQNKGLDEVRTLGLAFALHLLKSGSFIGFDKEGHLYLNLSSSALNPLGSGRSMSILAQGNLKEIWGKAGADDNSWHLTTKGGIVWNVGAHNTLKSNRSIDIRASRGIYFEAGSEDESGFARQDVSHGDVYEYVHGVKNEVVTDAHNLTVAGLREEHIMGSSSSRYDVDKSVNVQGVYSEVVIKEKQCHFGKRKTSITNGNDELNITKGDLTEIIKFGNRKSSVIVGNIEESIKAGNYKMSIIKGDYTVSIGVGNITIKTGIGDIRINSKKNVEISGLLKTIVKGLKVDVGNMPGGGVVIGAGTMPSHFDYITGLPLKGAMTVKAGP